MEMEMGFEPALGGALPTLASMISTPISPETISRMLMTAMSPLEGGGYNGGGGGRVRTVFPASSAAVAALEKHKFVVAGGRDDGGRGGGGGFGGGCSICLEEFEDGEEVSVMPCSSAHEFHQKCIGKWLGMRNTCPLCRHGLPTGAGDDDDQ